MINLTWQNIQRRTSCPSVTSRYGDVLKIELIKTNHFQLNVMDFYAFKNWYSYLCWYQRCVATIASFCLLNLVPFNEIRICCGQKPRFNSISYAYETK